MKRCHRLIHFNIASTMTRHEIWILLDILPRPKRYNSEPNTSTAYIRTHFLSHDAVRALRRDYGHQANCVLANTGKKEIACDAIRCKVFRLFINWHSERLGSITFVASSFCREKAAQRDGVCPESREYMRKEALYR